MYLKRAFKLLFVVYLFILGGCEQDITTSAPNDGFHNGKISVKSSPPGSMIYIDDKIYGLKTPNEINWIGLGEHKITLKKQYYRDTSFKVNIQDDLLNTFDINYYENVKMYGSAICDSDPKGAEIFINDSATGFVTPELISGLFPGSYKFELRKKEHRSFIKNFNMKSGVNTSVYSALEDTSVWVTFHEGNSGIPSDELTCLTIGADDLVWVGTVDYGVFSFDGKNIKKYSMENDGLPANKIFQLTTDLDGNIWMVANEGVAKFSNGSWTSFTPDNSGLYQGNFSTIQCDGQGSIWVGSNNGLNKFSGGSWTHYDLKEHGSVSNYVTCLGKEFEGRLVVGLGRNDPKINYDETFYSISGFPGNIQDTNINWQTAVDYNTETGELYFAWFSGLVKYNQTAWTEINIPVEDVNIRGIEAHEDQLWLATNKGLILYYMDAIRNFIPRIDNNLRTLDFWDIETDSKGNVWIASADGGLTKYKAFVNQ